MQSAVALLSFRVTQCPVSFKGLVALTSLSFINGMLVPSCVVQAPGVRASCTYAAVFGHFVIIYMLGALLLLDLSATTEFFGPARHLPSTRSAACRVLSDEGLLAECFQFVTTSWLTINSAVLCGGNVLSFCLSEFGSTCSSRRRREESSTCRWLSKICQPCPAGNPER